MADRNIDISNAFPKGPEAVDAQSFDLIVNMSGTKCIPTIRVPMEEWNIPDPIGQDEEAFRRAADLLEQHVMRLVPANPAQTASGAFSRRPPLALNCCMFELSPENAAAYLGYECSATLLGGGVSNTVVLIEAGDRPVGPETIAGQAESGAGLGSDRPPHLSRIVRDAPVVGPAPCRIGFPEILMEDSRQLPLRHDGRRLAPRGTLEGSAAARRSKSRYRRRLIGRLLGTMIAGTLEAIRAWKPSSAIKPFSMSCVWILYYRTTALRHPDLASFFSVLIDFSSLARGDCRWCMATGVLKIFWWPARPT